MIGSFSPNTPRTAGPAMRVAMGAIGAIALLAVSVFTAGGAFVGAFGILVAFAIAARRGRTLTRLGSWLGAVVAVALALLVTAAVGFARLPSGSVAQFQRSIDSVSANQRQQPPPAWVERMAPGATARSRARQSQLSPRTATALAVWGALMGGALVGIILSIMVGTLGWIPGLLLSHAFTGRWIGAREPAPAFR